MGLLPIKRNEDAPGRSGGTNGLDSVFNSADERSNWTGYFATGP